MKALRNNWMTWAKVHGWNGSERGADASCGQDIYLGVNGWDLVEVAPEEITCKACARALFPVPALSDMERLEAWLNGKPIA